MLAVTLVLVLVSVIQLVCVLALIDQYKGLLQIRRTIGLIDEPRTLELPVSVDALTLEGTGLPNVLLNAPVALVLFLSTKCTTCRSIAMDLRGRVPAPLWLVVEGPEPAREQWLREVGLSKEQLIDGGASELSKRLNLHVYPAGVVVEHGRVTKAQTLPSFRQLELLLKQCVPVSLAGQGA